MGTSRHFTITDDWVMLHPEVTPMQYFVYSLIKGNIRHSPGGIPETGFRATAAWIETLTEGKVKRRTAGEALRALAALGVLRRLNDPQAGDGAEFEFVVDPGPQYKGHRSVMTRAQEMERRSVRGVSFRAISVSGHPSNGPRKNLRAAPKAPSFEENTTGPEGPEGDLDGEIVLDPDAFPGSEDPASAAPIKTVVITDGMRDLAKLLVEKTARKSGPQQLLEGTCQRIAEAYRDALDRGWEPDALATRLAAELKPKIHSPERFLILKAKDFGDPPRQRSRPGEGSDVVTFQGKKIDLSRAHEMRRVKEEAQPEDPEEERRKAEERRKFQEKADERKRKRLAGTVGLRRSN